MNWNYDLHRTTARERQERAERRNQERGWLNSENAERNGKRERYNR